MTTALPRSSGILLHPTSLPGPFGIGDLGPMAFRWVETLAAMKQKWWQILPLGPTGPTGSPYQSFSAFASDIKLLSPEVLEQEGLVSRSLWAGQRFSDDRVEFDQVVHFKIALLHTAWENFQAGKATQLKNDFEAYISKESGWLNDYALFMAIHESLKEKPLAEWPKELLQRRPEALAKVQKDLAGPIGMHKFGQFLFDRQWAALRKFAADRGIKLIGDASIFVAGDSTDVWDNAEQFLLDAGRHPTVVAGVPPDYFSEDGQNWGNPIYDWKRMAETKYRWWCDRMQRQLNQVDMIRLDHFRGFCQAWHIPAGEKTARIGKWVDGPGIKLFEQFRAVLKQLPIIAEDLGLITPDVNEVRDKLGLPGMRVLQFSLEGPASVHWPHNFITHCVCYTGTHDNDTTRGWYSGLNDKDRNYLSLTLGKTVGDPAWDMIRSAWSSVAMLAIAPLQDVLSLGSEARMNTPGVAEGNWRWRFRLDQFRTELISRLADLTTLYNRVPKAESNV